MNEECRMDAGFIITELSISGRKGKNLGNILDSTSDSEFSFDSDKRPHSTQAADQINSNKDLINKKFEED
eukprot:CAMPEP_0205806748 /NCGR_PEP_ID=MMETSP0205-20121125/10383_1 /ASSEMBLY_ACC=CAM_ASM_000278 /TAXON_ID=36767 /ORGANISM="Euplotes focardii, Strain TN1" /LENGTH=69 /DNA_ID=CAMNT_0053080099 /DNA_START=160 /DNA_END=369 /DNA_ORIENTATION=+